MKYKISTVVLSVILLIESIFFIVYALSPKNVEEKLERIDTDIDAYEDMDHVGYEEALRLDDSDYYIYTYKIGCPYCFKAEEKVLKFGEVANIYVINIEKSIVDAYNEDPTIEIEKEGPDPSKHIIMSVPILYHIVDGEIIDYYYDYQEINDFIDGYFEGMKHNNS